VCFFLAPNEKGAVSTVPETSQLIFLEEINASVYARPEGQNAYPTYNLHSK